MMLVGVLVSTTPAAAAPGQWTLGFSPTYAFVMMEDQSEPDGGGAAIFLAYSLTESVALRLSGLWTGHGVEAVEDDKQPSGLLHVISLTAGLSYALDLLAVTPALEAGIGVLHQRLGDASSTELGLQLGLSVDYWLLSWLSVGAAFHYHAFLTNLAEYPVYFDTGPRISVRWP